MELKQKYPKRLHIEVTSRCNFKCLTCKHGFVNYGNDMSETILKTVIEELLPYANEIEMQGTGESLLSPNFNRLFDATKQYPNIKKILITNASLISEEQISDFVRSNMELIVSLDGASFDSYRLNRPVGDFGKIMSTLKKIGEEREKNGNSKFSYIINMVATRENFHCIAELINLAKQIGVDFVHISEVRECMPDKSTWDRLKLDQYDERSIFETYVSNCAILAEETGVGFSFNPYEKRNQIKKKICVSPWQHVFIGADGEVKFCCEQNFVIGNLLHESFDEIWSGEKATEFRNCMIEGSYHSICRNCCLPWGITYE